MKRGDPKAPPADLAARTLTTKPARGRFWRCAALSRPLVDWDERPTSRFSQPGVPVLYLAGTWETAFYEVFGEDLLDMLPEDRAITEATLSSREWVEFHITQDLRLLDVTDSLRQREIGADGSTFRANYAITQTWAAALHANPAIDGLLYASRLDDPRLCIALFGKPKFKSFGDALFTAAAGKKLSEDSDFLLWLLNSQKIVVKS